MAGVDLATLAIKVESQQVQSAQQGLDQLAKSGASAEQAVNKLGSSSGAMGGAISMAHGHITAMVATLAGLIGVTVSVAGAFALVKKGIEEITSYNIGAIASAAMMLSRANIEGIDAQRVAYGGYKAYVLSMYEALEAETQRHFASGKEMIGGFDAFARKGIYAAKEEAGAVGVITDAVKLLHGGYVDQSTMLHEIQGVLEGHAGIHFKLAQTLKGIIGPEWKEIVQSHVKDGTLLTFLEEKFKGLAVAGGNIQENLQAQGTTLYTLISQVGRGGLAGLYGDIVGLVSNINEYLREHKDSLIGGIKAGWEGLKEVMNDAYIVVRAIYNIVSTPIIWSITVATSIIGPAAKWLAGGEQIQNLANVMGADATSGPTVFSPEVQRQWKQKHTEDLIKQAEELQEKTGAALAKAPPWSPAKPDQKKGKGGKDDGTDRMRSIMDTLDKEFAKMSEGSLAEVDAWEKKMVDDINKVAAKGAEGAEAIALAHKVAGAKKMKIEDEFNLYVAKETGDRYAAIDEKYNQDVIKYKGTKDEMTKLDAIRTEKRKQVDYTYYADIENLQKDSLSKYAAALPLLSQQLPIQKQLLNVEIERARLSLEEKIRRDRIPEYIANELRGLQAVAAQEQRNAEARKGWMLQGWQGGLKIAGVESQNTAATWQAEQVSSFLKSAPQQISQTMASTFVGALQGKKPDLQALSYQMAEWLIQKQLEGMLVQIMPKALEGLMWLLGIEYTGKTLAAQNAALIGLTAAEQEAVLKVRAAEEAASISKGGGSGGGWLSSIIGGIGSIVSGLFGGTAPTLSTYYVPGGGPVSIPSTSTYAPAGLYHSGGIIRAHAGLNLASDEVPIIAQTGERVLSRGQNADYERGGSGPPQVNLTIIQNSSKVETKTEQNAQGDLIVTIDDLVSKAYAGRGKLHKLINSGNSATRR